MVTDNTKFSLKFAAYRQFFMCFPITAFSIVMKLFLFVKKILEFYNKPVKFITNKS